MLLILENGRIRLLDKEKETSRFIPWNVLKNGQILDPNQLYYHINKLLEVRGKNQPVQVFFPSPQTYVFSYPGQDLSLGDRQKIEAFKEEEKGLDLKEWVKNSFSSNRHIVSYFDRKSMDSLQEIFDKLEIPFSRLSFVNQSQKQVLMGAEYAYFFNPSTEESLHFSFSSEGVDYFMKKGLSSKEAYGYLDQTLSPENQEDLSRFLTIFYLERLANFKDALQGVETLAMERGLYRDYLQKIQDPVIEDLKIFPPEPMKDKKESRPVEGRIFSDIFQKRNLKFFYPLVILVLLISSMAFHYHGLRKELARTRTRASETTNRRRPYGPVMEKIDLDFLEDFSFEYDQDQCRLTGTSPRLDAIAKIKDQVKKEGLEILHEEIYFQEGAYHFDLAFQ